MIHQSSLLKGVAGMRPVLFYMYKWNKYVLFLGAENKIGAIIWSINILDKWFDKKNNFPDDISCYCYTNTLLSVPNMICNAAEVTSNSSSYPQ